MAIITKEIKDEYVIGIAQQLGFKYDPKNVPPLADHIAAIQGKIDELIDPLYANVVLTDPAVIAKKAELDTLVQAKIDAAKVITK